MMEILSQAIQENELTLEKEQMEKIIYYIELLKEWNQKINLTAHRTDEEIIYKDIIDTLYLETYIKMYILNECSCLDLGSGAGFNGIILSILHPEAKFVCLDADRKKINFIKQIIRELHLANCTTLNQRAEGGISRKDNKYQLIISRATWSIADYLKVANNYVQNSGHVVYMCGRTQKNSSPLSQEYQGLAGGEKVFYKIRPKNYERALLIFKKMH